MAVFTSTAFAIVLHGSRDLFQSDCPQTSPAWMIWAGGALCFYCRVKFTVAVAPEDMLVFLLCVVYPDLLTWTV
jgi:hypothetical protein